MLYEVLIFITIPLWHTISSKVALGRPLVKDSVRRVNSIPLVDAIA